MALIQVMLFYSSILVCGVHALVPGLYCGDKNCYDGKDFSA